MARPLRRAAPTLAIVTLLAGGSAALFACGNGDDDDHETSGDASADSGHTGGEDSSTLGSESEAGATGDATATDGASGDGGSDGGASGDGGSDGEATHDAEAGAAAVAMYVASGYQNRRIVSLDGKNWINDIQDAPSSLDDIATGLTIGNGTIVAAGHTGIYTSHDGKTWTHLPAPVPQVWPGLGGAAAIFVDGRFVIVADGDSWTSTDAVTFTKTTPTPSVSATHWNGIAYGNGHYFAAGDSNGPGDRKVSEDGLAWHDYVQDGKGWSGIAFGNGVFVLAGQSGRRAWTTDGTTLTDTTDSSLGDTSGLTFGDGKFVLTAGGGGATSTDGKTWTKVSNLPNGYLSFGSGLFLANTWVANILTSTSGTAFSTVYSSDAGAQALSRTTWGMVGGE